MEDLYVILGIIGGLFLFFLLMALYNKARDRKASHSPTLSSKPAAAVREPLPDFSTLEYCVNGLQYQGVSAIEAARKLKEDEVVYLVPEPENRYDANAVRVETGDGIQIGYVPRSCSAPFARAIRNDNVTITAVKEVKKNKAVPLVVLTTMFTEKVVVDDPNVIDADEPVLTNEETGESMDTADMEAPGKLSILGYSIMGLYACSEEQLKHVNALCNGELVYPDIDPYNPAQVMVKDATGNYLGHIAEEPSKALIRAIQTGRLIKTEVGSVSRIGEFPSVQLCSWIQE